MTNWETIAQTEDFIIDYDKTRAMYRVSYFEDNHFVDDVMFDAYEPVVHGEWVKTHYIEVKRCSCCNTPINIFKEAHIYCSTCGARMDEGNKNEI